jgi:hypothetical protein
MPCGQLSVSCRETISIETKTILDFFARRALIMLRYKPAVGKINADSRFQFMDQEACSHLRNQTV